MFVLLGVDARSPARRATVWCDELLAPCARLASRLCSWDQQDREPLLHASEDTAEADTDADLESGRTRAHRKTPWERRRRSVIGSGLQLDLRAARRWALAVFGVWSVVGLLYADAAAHPPKVTHPKHTDSDIRNGRGTVLSKGQMKARGGVHLLAGNHTRVARKLRARASVTGK